jgi:peptide deformylase
MIALLKKTRDPKGVGLAATQVGLDKRIFVLIPDKTPLVFINPKVTKKSKAMFSEYYSAEEDNWLEGCLSIPKVWGFVDRPYKITLRYQTIDTQGNLVDKLEEFSDIEAAYVQHEIDHLDGILFTDRILQQGGQLFQEEKGKLYPVKFS